MTPDDMARLHKAAFINDRPWSTDEFTDMLGTTGTRVFTHRHGFALVRQIVDEAELLTLAVDPTAQRTGIARGLMSDWMAQVAENGAKKAFLEVAADNTPAICLYHSLGFSNAGTRPNYYKRRFGPPISAILMQTAL